MVRISKLADYAVVVLVRLGTGEIETAPGIAQATGVPEPTVAKVLKALAGAGLVASQRGARGGYRLTRPLAHVSVADVVDAIDGPITLTACVERSPTPCEAECFCPVRGRWDPVNAAVREALESVSLARLAAHPGRPARPSLPQPV
jgi:FeS assembly SUF system regulator